jgi:hypothetical protein
MCPACLAATATSVVGIAAGVTSAGGVAAVVVARLAGRSSEAKDATTVSVEGEDNGAAKNRLAR